MRKVLYIDANGRQIQIGVASDGPNGTIAVRLDAFPFGDGPVLVETVAAYQTRRAAESADRGDDDPAVQIAKFIASTGN